MKPLKQLVWRVHWLSLVGHDLKIEEAVAGQGAGELGN